MGAIETVCNTVKTHLTCVHVCDQTYHARTATGSCVEDLYNYTKTTKLHAPQINQSLFKVNQQLWRILGKINGNMNMRAAFSALSAFLILGKHCIELPQTYFSSLHILHLFETCKEKNFCLLLFSLLN